MANDSPTAAPQWWLFGPRADVVVFLGSALLSLLALAFGAYNGYLHSDAPEWSWIAAVLLVDVAHVWSTGFRVYLDPQEIGRRPLLYIGTPVVAWLAGILVYSSQGATVFWRVIAYLAVYHFVRQQYGWVALYRAKLGEQSGRRLDTATIYMATLYPLLYWHANLPRRFSWLAPNDISLPVSWGDPLSGTVTYLVAPLYWILLTLYTLSSLKARSQGRANPGKDMVVATTAICWYVGIVGLNSDYAFTVTNVLIHGIPYMALVYFWQKRRNGQVLGFTGYSGVWPFLITLWALAYGEEMLWDRGINHERSWLFGSPWDIGDWGRILLAPLLTVPQLTHYVLDGFIWKRRTNPAVQKVVLAQP